MDDVKSSQLLAYPGKCSGHSYRLIKRKLRKLLTYTEREERWREKRVVPNNT